MTISRLFRLSIYLLVFSSHLSIILTPEIPYEHAALLMALLFFAWLYERTHANLPRLFFNAVLIIILLSSLAYAVFLTEYFFKAGIYFLAYVLAVRMFSLESERDTWLVFLLSFLEVCAASILTISINFLASLFIYLVLAGFSLTVFNLRREMTSVAAKDKPDTVRSLRSPFMALTGTTAILVFITAICLFFFLPRLGRGLFSWRTRTAPRVAGFAESVQLGEVGPMIQNRAVVLRARIKGEDEPRDGSLRWRGMALEYYDVGAWSDVLGLKILKYYRYDRGVSVKDKFSFRGQETAEIFLEPIVNAVLFAPEGVEGFHLPPKFRGVEIYYNDYYGLPIRGGLNDRISYQAYFRTPSHDAAELSGAYEGVDRKDLRREMFDYMLYPLEAEPVCEFARSIAGDDENPYAQTLSIIDHLETNYVYNISASARSQETALEEFLFETKEGYCEHFATATAIMLRCLDVPTRLVTGFSQGTWNPIEKYYLVRQSDAHAWVEVYFPGAGWVGFDPSPIQIADQQGYFQSRLDQIIDSIMFRWNRWIVDYSVLDQMEGFKIIQSRGFRLRREFVVFADALRYRLMAVLYNPRALSAVGVVVAIVVMALLFFRRPRRARGEADRLFPLSSDQEQAVRHYRRMLALLKKRGYVRKDSQTATEFAADVIREAGPEFQPVAGMTEIYERVRFGMKPFTSRMLDEFKRELAKFRKLGRSK